MTADREDKVRLICLLDEFGGKYFSELVSAWDFSADLESHSHSFPADANESIAQVVQVLPAIDELSVGVRSLDCLCADDDLASIFVITFVLKIGREGLGFRSHQCAHACFNDSYGVEISRTIIINDCEFELLHLFKVVLHRNCRFEVWIQRVLYLLSLSNFDPAA